MPGHERQCCISINLWLYVSLLCFQPIRIYTGENCTWAPLCKLVTGSYSGGLIEKFRSSLLFILTSGFKKCAAMRNTILQVSR
jgi:hypothetical protein